MVDKLEKIERMIWLFFASGDANALERCSSLQTRIAEQHQHTTTTEQSHDVTTTEPSHNVITTNQQSYITSDDLFGTQG